MKKHLLSKILVAVTAIVLVGCGGKTKFVNYIDDESVRLTLDYKGHDFYTDGIGQMKLKSPIDGDTAHFTPVITTTSSETVKSRFFGIDTPESTGKVQEWGKAASNFTKEKLKEADENGTIVVSTARNDYGVPEKDSTGERYVSLIWVCLDKKDAPISDLRLFNLWLVQEGYSYVKNVNNVPQYSDIFIAAETQAKEFKLVLHSDDPDPDFNYGDYEDTSLLDLKLEIEKSLADSSYKNKYDNQKVRIQGTVAGFANHILYLQSYFSPANGGRGENGEYAGINIFTGMGALQSRFTTRNTYLQLCGLAQDSDEFGFQITSVYSFSILAKDENDTQVLIKPEDNTDEFKLKTFEFKPAELGNANYGVLFCSVKLTEPVEVSDAYIASNSEITLYLKGIENSVYVSFVYKGDPDNPNQQWDKKEKFVGHKFLVQGIYTFHKTSSGKVVWQINPTSNADLIFVE